MGGACTIEQLIDKHEVVLNSLLIKLAKVAPAEANQAVQKLKDESGIGIALGDGDQVDVLVLDMAEGGASEGEDRRPDLGVRDHLNPEDVGQAGSAVVAEGAEDEVLALLVEDEDAGQHVGGCYRRPRTAASDSGLGVGGRMGLVEPGGSLSTRRRSFEVLVAGRRRRAQGGVGIGL